jgi:UDP-perosamine 4-acetyltransferase
MMRDIGLPVIVIGAGGHAKVLISALMLQKRNILGFVDLNPALPPLLGARHLGDDSAVLEHSPASVQLVNGVGSVHSTSNRRAIYDRFVQKQYCFATVVHPSAIVAPEVQIENGAQMFGGAIVQAGCRVGVNVVVNTGARVDHDCVIDAHTHIAPGVTICGGVHVGEGAYIGAGATIIQGIQIGEGCVVGAGALVIRDVARASTVVGVPATSITARGKTQS